MWKLSYCGKYDDTEYMIIFNSDEKKPMAKFIKNNVEELWDFFENIINTAENYEDSDGDGVSTDNKLFKHLVKFIKKNKEKKSKLTTKIYIGEIKKYLSQETTNNIIESLNFEQNLEIRTDYQITLEKLFRDSIKFIDLNK